MLKCSIRTKYSLAERKLYGQDNADRILLKRSTVETEKSSVRFLDTRKLLK